MKRVVFIIFGLHILAYIYAQNNYFIDIRMPEKEIIKGHLDLGGKNPAGDELSVNSYYIEKNGKAFIPIIGEFHFCRFNSDYWEEEIKKIKAGGVNTIATYVFWNIHEREEGVFDWTGDLNLRKFVELIDKHHLYAIVRIGPFCHGEIRNGGLPDWLYGRPFEVRSNDTAYLQYVEKLYNEIAKQISGLLFKDGGPVIGVQLENEYQHSAAPWEFSYPGSLKEYTVADWDAAFAHEQISVTGSKNPRSEYGKKHMNNLKNIAGKVGIDVPVYTATGWGNATIIENGSLPVTAGYAYPFWEDPHPSSFYLFKDIHKNPDYSPVSYNAELYPSIAGEIGPGIQPKYSRRPFVDYESVNPLMVRTIGSGANGIGYYMYHGGSTPQFNGKFYNEEINGLPRVNYDFQAPLGQYGQVRYHYKHLRLLHMFLEAYGDQLAPMKTVLPETNPSITPEDTKTLRYAVRSYGNSGFLFIINFQDHMEIQDINDVSIKVEAAGGQIRFPANGTMTILKATSAILPFNLKLGNALVKSATVQPMTVLVDEDAVYYIFSSINGIKPELNFTEETRISGLKNAVVVSKNGIKTITGKEDEPFAFSANSEMFLVLPQSMAINAIKAGGHLVFSQELVLADSASLRLISKQINNEVHIFPAREMHIKGQRALATKIKPLFDGFASYAINVQELKPDVSVEKISAKKYTLCLSSDIGELNDVYVNIDYTGDRALAFINGILITDHFYQGRIWEISLRQNIQTLKDNKMVFIFHPMHETYPYVKDLKLLPEFTDGGYLRVDGMEIIPEYKVDLAW